MFWWMWDDTFITWLDVILRQLNTWSYFCDPFKVWRYKVRYFIRGFSNPWMILSHNKRLAAFVMTAEKSLSPIPAWMERMVRSWNDGDYHASARSRATCANQACGEKKIVHAPVIYSNVIHGSVTFTFDKKWQLIQIFMSGLQTISIIIQLCTPTKNLENFSF